MMEKEIEPVCKHVMIDEYARTRRNIIEKEIEPTCREILEEEVPSLCEALVNKEFNQIRRDVMKEEIKPVCREVIDEEVTDIVKNAIRDEYDLSRQHALAQDLEPICRTIIRDEVDRKCKEIVDQDIDGICRDAVREELEGWARKEHEHQMLESPVEGKKVYRQHAKSAKQLPQRFSRIEESVLEESPDALPRHNMPPQSYVDGRSSVMHSESNYDAYSVDDRQFRLSAEPHGTQSRLSQGGDKTGLVRESQQDRLRDYLRDKFRPPSDTRSQERRSARSLSNSKTQLTPDYKGNQKSHGVSFGISDVKEESSLGQYSASPSRESKDQYSFLDRNSRARQIMNTMDKTPVETHLKNRVSFGGGGANEEFKISSTPMLHHSDDFAEGNRFGYAKKTPQMKSQKYVNNVRMFQHQYMDVQDVIRENKKHNRGQL